MAKQKHPLEYFAQEYRAKENPYSKLKENSLLLTNFPSDVLITKDYIKNLCMEKDKTAIINQIYLNKSAVENTQFNDTLTRSNKIAYAIVEFDEISHMKSVRKGLRKLWINDKLLKVRTIDDKNSENHGLRTVILQNIPLSLQPIEIAEPLSKFGAIVGIEVPKVDHFIQAEIKNQGKDYYSIQRKAKREQEFRLAQQLVQESLELDEEMQTIIKNQNQENMAEEIIRNYKNSLKGYENFNVFDKQKFNSFQFTNEQENMDPIHKLQRMSLAEITHTYDVLLSILLQRESLIKKRLFKTLQHFGDEERILFESHDFSKEQETMPNILLRLYKSNPDKIDRYLSINEQIDHIQLIKNIPPQEKLYQWFTNTAAFTEEANFGFNQLAYANTNEFNNDRELIFPHNIQTKSDLAKNGKAPQPFFENKFKEIQQKAQQVRKDTDFPYDELYHKEKKLVQDIIRAQKSIQQTEENLPNPSSDYMFNINDLPEQTSEYGNIYEDLYQKESQFIQDKKNQQKIQEQNSLQNPNEINMYANEAQFAYKQQEQLTINQMIEKGQIDRQQYENARAQHILNKDINLGYAFITFSHADEATQMLILTQGKLFINNNYIQVLLKNKLDHSEIDKQYFLKKLQNESQIIEQRQELRESQQKLREFERQIDKELPNQKRLKEFKSLAQEILENPQSKTRRHQSQRRTKREQQELYDKLQDVQKQNPNIDLTQLFENEKMDRMRTEMHKRSFMNYKQFEFLKAGIYSEDQIKEHKKTQSLGKSQQYDVFEPFNYPPLEQSVASILIDGVQGKVNNPGSKINQKGRKFEFTEKDFLVSYLGKDYMNRVDLSSNEYIQTFGFHETIRDLIPEKTPYLELPKTEQNKQKLINYFGAKSVDGEYLDPEFIKLLQSPSEIVKMTNLIFDKFDVHDYNDKNRTLFGELNNKLQEVRTRLGQKDAKEGMLPINELKNIFYETFVSFKHPFIGKKKENREFLNQMKSDLDNAENKLKTFETKLNKSLDDNGQFILTEQQQATNNQIVEDLLKKSNQSISLSQLKQDQSNFDEEKQIKEEKLNEILMKYSKTDRYKIKEKLNELEQEVQQSRKQQQQNNYNENDFSDEEFYENKSMFRPFSTQNKQNEQNQKVSSNKDQQKNVGQNKAEQKKSQKLKNIQTQIQLEYLPQSLQISQKNRENNENIYNIMHQEKIQDINVESEDINFYHKIAQKLTKQRKQEFEKIKKQQLQLDPQNRTPYFIDVDGNLKPFTKEMIEKTKQKKVKIPNNVPTYEQSKQNITMESIINMDSYQDNLAQTANSQEQNQLSQEKQIQKEILEDIEFKEELEREQLFDVLNLEANEAIKDVTISDVLKQLKGKINVEETLDSQIGLIHTYQKTFMDEQDLAKHNFRENVGGGKYLDEFIDEKADKKDIYEQYKEKIQNDQQFQKLRQEALQNKNDSQILNNIYNQAEESIIKTPDLANYFQQTAMDKQITDLFSSIDYDKQLEQEEYKRIIEEQEVDSKYRKELLARMYGGKLTSRQYGVLLKMSDDSKEQAKIINDEKEKNFQQTKDVIRNGEELVEQYRRKMVHTGQWQEKESHQNIQNLLDEIVMQYPTKKSLEIATRDQKIYIQQMMLLSNSDSKMEREYYFDEGLGQSLNDHIQNLKTTYPTLTIQTRRDRDGFPVVKISMKPQYQYNLDDILQTDPQQLKQIQLDTQETVLSVFMPENPKQFIQSVAQLTSDQSNNSNFYDKYTLTKLNQLIKQRFFGKYKENHEAFVNDCKLLKKEFEENKKKKKIVNSDIDNKMQFSENGIVFALNNQEKNDIQSQVFNEILQDQERLDFEIQHQIQMKIQDKLLFQKRQKSELVKPAQSETRVFKKQVSRLEETIQILQKDNEWLLNAGNNPQEEQSADFDKEKFTKLKQEIKRRKEAKQKILNQGFPEFQSYTRL